ncbi:Subtilisin-like protease SBT1.7 [Linum grandiflorum]
MLYTYNHAIHGYSTRLTSAQAKLLQSHPGILSVIPETRYQLHTTHTPQFLGLDLATQLFPQADTLGEVVVGVLDTGVWPESKSFDDTGFGPLPGTWNGECEIGTNFTTSNCNRKLIGARFFAKDDGHGTHTSTTAAGSAVDGASLLGYASGTARGMASRARVAVYKVCWVGGCFSSDILAAMDKAIEDGVNVLSMSLGGGNSDYYRDSVAIGAFSAMEKGILVSCSAGNAGPTSYSLSNVAPWITTVGGNASNATNGNLCMMGTLIPEKVKGKIVLCDRGVNARVQKGAAVKAAGGLGMVLANTEANGEELVADAHLLPATAVGQKTGDAIKKYLTSDPSPTATILFEGTKLGIEPSPVVAAFSSRGPNSITPEILKPDIIAPGAEDYLGFLCALNYTDMQIKSVARKNYTCDHSKKYSVANLNYPSFAVNVDTTQMTLTNVEVGPGAEYTVSVSPKEIPGVKIEVEPTTLSFENVNEKKTYTVTFTADSMPMSTNSFARLEWSNGKRTVGSPIAVSWT